MGTDVIQKLNKTLPRHCLIIIYKSFARLHVDCGDILYDQSNNESVTHKNKTIYYNAALAITNVINLTSQGKFYSELSFESMKFRRWFRKLCIFFKLKTSDLPEYLFHLVPQNSLFGRYYNIYSRTDALK